jgi:hypothetical protein
MNAKKPPNEFGFIIVDKVAALITLPTEKGACCLQHAPL